MAGTMVQLCRSTDTGAPSLNGTAGSLITVLDACLVTGYNNKTVTSITRVGQTATVHVQTGHGLPADGGPKVKISGSNQAAYNGNFQYTYVDATYFTITVEGTPTSPATGSMTTSIAPLGWNKPFSGTNLAAYQSAEPDSTKMYMRVDDTPGQYATFVGCEYMRDLNTAYGGLFPTTAQLSGGLYITKSFTTDSVIRNWVVVGDGYEFFIACAFNLSGAVPWLFELFHFGDPCSEMLSDPYGCLIFGSSANSYNQWPGARSYAQTIHTGAGLAASDTYHYLARGFLQTGKSVFALKHGNFTLGGSGFGFNAVVPYPNPADNGLHISPIFVTDPYCVRAQLKGLWQPLHTRPLGHGYLLPTDKSPIGRRLYAIALGFGSSATPGECLMDIDGPWR